MQKNYKEAVEKMSYIIKYMKDENKAFYTCVYNYLKGMQETKKHKTVIEYLRKFFNKEVLEKVYYIFKDSEKVIIKQYRKHDYRNRGVCLKDKCYDYSIYSNCVDKFKEIQIKNPIKQIELRRTFEVK